MIDREFNQFNMPEKMPEQNGDEKDAEESQEKNGLESLEKIRNELESLAQDYHLIAHQTMHDSAEKIIADDYFSDTGLQGTSLLLSVDSIMESIA